MKKKVVLTVIAALAMLFVFAGCNVGVSSSVRGRGAMEVYTIDVANFTGIEIGGLYEIEWIRSDTFNVTLEIQSNLFEYVDARVSGNRLILDSNRSFNVSSGNTPVLRIYAPFIDDIRIGGAANIRNWDDIILDQLTIHLAGAANVELSGSVLHLYVTTAGASNLELFGLRAVNATIDVSGAASVEVYATETLNASIAGVGSITYDGNPTVTRSVAGLGRITAR